MAHHALSYNQSILEHFEQKFLSDDAIDSSGVPRSIIALYTLIIRCASESKTVPDVRESLA